MHTDEELHHLPTVDEAGHLLITCEEERKSLKKNNKSGGVGFSQRGQTSPSGFQSAQTTGKNLLPKGRFQIRNKL